MRLEHDGKESNSGSGDRHRNDSGNDHSDDTGSDGGRAGDDGGG